MNKSAIKLAYLVTHPIQYQAPLLRLISQEPDIDLTVFFSSDISVKEFRDKGFCEKIEWDVPLLAGYKHEFLPSLGPRDRISFWFPLNHGLMDRLKSGSFDAVWIHGYGHIGHLWAVLAMKRLGGKVFMRGESSATSAPRGRFKIYIKKILLTRLFDQIDGFLCIGSMNRDYYREHGVQEGKLFLMPYAVDNEFFRRKAEEAAGRREVFLESIGLDPGRPVILYASKFMARKHPMDLLEAYISLSPDGLREPDPYLLFVGNGEERNKLEKRAIATGWNSIRFMGFRNQSELPAFYDLCDLFVLPSTHEPWGLVINEVMNAAKPVIVTAQVGCAPDLVENGGNGYVVPVRDIVGLSHAIASVLGDPARARKMGERSLEKIQDLSFREDIRGIRTALGLEAVAE